MRPRTKKEAPYGTATHCILRVQLRRVPRVPCRSARQRRTAAACSALFRARAPGFCLARWTVQAAAAMPRPCSAQGAPWRTCAGARGLAHCAACGEYPCAIVEKSLPCGSAGRAALDALRLKRPAAAVGSPRPLFCAKNAACTGRASTEKHAFFAGAISHSRRHSPRPAPSLLGVFSGMRRKTKAFNGAPHTGPASVFYIEALR